MKKNKKTKIYFLVFLIFFISIPNSSHSILTNGTTPDDQYIKLGNKFPEVGHIRIFTGNDPTQYASLTGTLITDRHILTCAHGIDTLISSQHYGSVVHTDKRLQQVKGHVTILFPAQGHRPKIIRKVEKIIIHPLHIPTEMHNGDRISAYSSVSEHDIAILELNQSIGTITPRKIFSPKSEDVSYSTFSATVVGFGVSDNGVYDHQKRAGHLPFITSFKQEEIDQNELFFNRFIAIYAGAPKDFFNSHKLSYFEKLSQASSSSERNELSWVLKGLTNSSQSTDPLSCGIASGDSGGPLIYEDRVLGVVEGYSFPTNDEDLVKHLNPSDMSWSVFGLFTPIIDLKTGDLEDDFVNMLMRIDAGDALEDDEWDQIYFRKQARRRYLNFGENDSVNLIDNGRLFETLRDLSNTPVVLSTIIQIDNFKQLYKVSSLLPFDIDFDHFFMMPLQDTYPLAYRNLGCWATQAIKDAYLKIEQAGNFYTLEIAGNKMYFTLERI